jgi:hypothetical protein
MTLRSLLGVTTVALVVVAGGRPAFAQQSQQVERFEFKTSFDFIAHGQTFTAGPYTIFANDAHDMLTLEPTNMKQPKQAGVLLPVATRISERKALSAAEVVFDKVGTKFYLSELQMPGEDGYLVLATKEAHTHTAVTGTRIKK